MLLLGPHCRKMGTTTEQAHLAKSAGWTCFQTAWGNIRSTVLSDQLMGRPISEFKTDYDPGNDPVWIFHASYMAHCTPRDQKQVFITTKYLKTLLLSAKMVGASYVVVHTGGTKDRLPQQVSHEMRSYLEKYIVPYLEDLNKSGHQVRLAVENVAAAYPFNTSLVFLPKSVEGLPYVGWTLDTAHAFAAGVPGPQLLDVVRYTPPAVAHINYPGSNFGSGLDRHGWRYNRTPYPLTDQSLAIWDDTIRLLAKSSVPLIVEGGSVDGELDRELAFLRELLTTL